MSKILFFLIMISVAAYTMQLQPKQYNAESTKALQNLLTEYLNDKKNFPTEPIKQLITQGSANPNIIVGNDTWLGVTLLTKAHVNISSHQNFISFLLERGSNPNLEQNQDALIAFISGSNECYNSVNRYQMIALFIKHGLEVTRRLLHDYTFLHYAVRYSQNIVPLLLENGAAIHITKSSHNRGHTPLNIAYYERDHAFPDEYQHCQQTITLLESHMKQKLS